MKDAIVYMINSNKKPTAKLTKAVDKILPANSLKQLAELGVKEIKLTSLNEIKKKVKNKEPL